MTNEQLRVLLSFAADGKKAGSRPADVVKQLSGVRIDTKRGRWIASDAASLVVVKDEGLKKLASEDAPEGFTVPASSVSLALRAGKKTDMVQLTREALNGVPYTPMVRYPSIERAIPAQAPEDSEGVVGFIASKYMARLEALGVAFGFDPVASLPPVWHKAVRFDLGDRIICVIAPIKKQTRNKFPCAPWE